MKLVKSLKLWIPVLMLSFSTGSFYAGQKIQSYMMLADGFISLADHKAIVSKEVAQASLKTKTRTKAIARMKRVLVAIPVAGIGLVGYFEKQDYDEWLEDHPEGNPQMYACEVSQISAAYVDELLQGFPEELSSMIPENVLSDLVPQCELSETK